MNLINSNVLTSISSLNTDKQAQTVLSNVLASHASAKIDSVMFPGGNIVITKQDGTSYEFLPATLWLKYSSLPSCALVSAEDNFPRGIISRGFIPYSPLALIASEIKSKIKTTVTNVISAKSVLIDDIKTGFKAIITDIQSTSDSAISETVIDNYLYLCETVIGDININGSLINVDNTRNQLNIESMQASLDQISSCLLLGKSEIHTLNVIDKNNIEVFLANWDYQNNKVAIEKLQTFNFTGVFDSDKTGILKKLSAQIINIKL